MSLKYAADDKTTGFLRNSRIIGNGNDIDLFVLRTDGAVVAQLDGYAVIPMDLFEAMGGTECAAYAEWHRSNALARKAVAN